MNEVHAREINTLVPELLHAALEHSRSIAGSELNTRSGATFKDVMSRVPAGISRDAVTFAVARLAAQIIDQLSAAAGDDAEEVIRDFRQTYLDTID